jgi:bifunctional ADP-heptose synthase (sugar kinase/adenylyltransferase)
MNILVIGEIILDTYLYCDSNRLATEGMFPIYNIKSTENKLGGAANVALNISNLNLTNSLIKKCKTLDKEQKERYIKLGKYCEECSLEDP